MLADLFLDLDSGERMQKNNLLTEAQQIDYLRRLLKQQDSTITRLQSERNQARQKLARMECKRSGSPEKWRQLQEQCRKLERARVSECNRADREAARAHRLEVAYAALAQCYESQCAITKQAQAEAMKRAEEMGKMRYA